MRHDYKILRNFAKFRNAKFRIFAEISAKLRNFAFFAFRENAKNAKFRKEFRFRNAKFRIFAKTLVVTLTLEVMSNDVSEFS